MSCSYTMENAWSRALEVPPITGVIEFVIDDERISTVNHSRFNPSDFGPVWDAFRSWVRANHPNEFDAIYESGSQTPVYTPEAATLWQQFTTEYVASLGT